MFCVVAQGASIVLMAMAFLVYLPLLVVVQILFVPGLLIDYGLDDLALGPGLDYACAYVWKWSGVVFIARCLIFLAKGLDSLFHVTVGRFFLYPRGNILAYFQLKSGSEDYAAAAFAAELVGFVAWSLPLVFPHLLIGDAHPPGSRAVKFVSGLFIVGATILGLGTVFWFYMLAKEVMPRVWATRKRVCPEEHILDYY
jgi:hypothetical protein